MSTGKEKAAEVVDPDEMFVTATVNAADVVLVGVSLKHQVALFGDEKQTGTTHPSFGILLKLQDYAKILKPLPMD
ncbi:hypothetical protein [Desulfosporosinus metallidurans]|uniref:Uncharacterized protein n=1 Tax=Desulfosporosinus metallidurans TaxID=1888891 RepID=A0A1Q8QH54_9FIRM|nr:hypothetical protein [Desulfosporosinus metallidurans]OLN26677.1 hypothetical protein DSOL_4895 [Desulfosporosinus metallidurans]